MFLYAMNGANGGHAAWAQHHQDASMDSIRSNFSVMCLGHPGVGDKMFGHLYALDFNFDVASQKRPQYASRK